MSSPAPKPRRPALRRRNLLAGGVAGLAVAAAAGEGAWRLFESTAGIAGGIDPTRGSAPVHMQIVAHPDDCLYFVNPRIARVLAAGAGIATVVLTAGEADGHNTHDRVGAPDFAGYAAARGTGLRRAYAHLATGDSESPWDRECIRLASGQHVERCILRERPGVHLIFCSLWTNLGRLTGDYTRLLGLWEGETDAHLILPPTDSPLTDETSVDRETVQDTLLELLDLYRPAVVNTLDPDPDPVPGKRLGAEQHGYSDHIDHTAAALFAWDAVREWGRAAAVESWRGYYNRRWPANLGAADRDAKGRAINVYAWADGFDCGENAGCGDRVVIGPGTGDTYGSATHPRYSASLATTDIDGEPEPITVHGMRARIRNDQTWDDLGGPDVLPAIAVAGSRLFAVGPDHAFEPGAHTRDLYCFDLAALEWTRLGNPAGSGELSRRIGAPTAATNGAMTVVAVRSPDRGLHIRTKLLGHDWSAWTHLDGRMTHDSPAALAVAGGFEIFAATPGGLAAWQWTGHGWTTRDLELPHVGGAPGYTPASAVTAAVAPDGRIVIASRSAGSSDVVLHYGRADTWTATLLRLDGGILPPTIAVAADGTVAVAVDDGAGAPAVAAVDLADLDHGPAERYDVSWSRGDIVVVRRPALAFDAAGDLRLWATGPDGEVYTARSRAGDRPPTAWAPALRQGD